MKCPNCNNEGYIEESFVVLEYEGSTSNWDDYDQMFKLQCEECGHEFIHID